MGLNDDQTTKINMHSMHVYIQCTLISVRITFGIRKFVWCLVSNHDNYTFLMYIVCHNGLSNGQTQVPGNETSMVLRQIIQISNICL